MLNPILDPSEGDSCMILDQAPRGTAALLQYGLLLLPSSITCAVFQWDQAWRPFPWNYLPNKAKPRLNLKS